MAWAKARPSQAGASNFGPAQDFVRPRPPKARPKPPKPGQAGPCTTLIYCVDTSVAVEFDNDAETMLNAKQIGDMHCECRFTGSGVARNPKDITHRHSEVLYQRDEIPPSTVMATQCSGLMPCIEVFENLVVFVCPY